MPRRTLTAIKFRPKNPSRAAVYLDGRFAFELDAAVAAPLMEGQELTENQIQKLRYDDEKQRCFSGSVRHLARRPRSEAQTRHWLTSLGFGNKAVDHAIERLKSAGYLDDAAYARDWVSFRQRRQPRSAYALGYELRQKGVADTIISRVLKDVDDDAAARKALKKKWRQWQPHEPRQCRPKMMRFLLSRGFGHDTARTSIDRALKDPPS